MGLVRVTTNQGPARSRFDTSGGDVVVDDEENWPVPRQAVPTAQPVLASAVGQEISTDRQTATNRTPSRVAASPSLDVTARWTGTVEEVRADTFSAAVEDSEGRFPPHEVELSTNILNDFDLPLLAPGASFHWVMGYRRSTDGYRRFESRVRIRRIPPVSIWRRKAGERWAEEFRAALGIE
jgi:hypothetical protein